MEINKGKILVYVLTFAAYTWTGYGSGILGHLKDAVITAEGFFGEFLEKAVDIVKNIKDVKQKIDSTVGEKCIFECPNGKSSYLVYVVYFKLSKLKSNFLLLKLFGEMFRHLSDC